MEAESADHMSGPAALPTSEEAQAAHDRRRAEEPGHDACGCWCCCVSCDFDYYGIVRAAWAPLLVVRVAGGVHMMHETFEAGRGSGLRIDDEAVSRRHARFSASEGDWYVEDLGSANGTYINGSWERLAGRRRLREGDRIRMGRTTLVVSPQ